MIQLKDNSDVTQYKDDLIIQELLNRDLNNLSKSKFIIFPPQIKSSEDLDGENFVFQEHNSQISNS